MTERTPIHAIASDPNLDAAFRRILGGAPDGTYQFRTWYIPSRMMVNLRAYIEHGRPVGDFLTAVLANDLSGACSRADDENLENLPAYCVYLYNEAPPACYGTREKVSAWLAKFKEQREKENT